MKNKLFALAPYAAFLGIDFYLLPLLMRNTGAAILMLLCVMPAAAFITAVIHGARHGFGILLPIAAFLLFIPTVFIYYNSSAWFYAVLYAIVVLAGAGMGGACFGRR